MNPAEELDDMGAYLSDLWERAVMTGDYPTQAAIKRMRDEWASRQPDPVQVALHDELFGVQV